ncbi:MAG: PEP-CTERM sorting domain-containing protein [Myxococcota bacterium]
MIQAVFAGRAGALTIIFDDTAGLAPPTFAQAVPGGEFGPVVADGPVTVQGGVILLAITPSDQAATSLPNLYATTDFLPLADGTLLPGSITGSLAISATSVSLAIGNGHQFPATFTLTAFKGASPVASDAVSLDPFGSGAGFVGQLSVAAGEGITSFTVASDQPLGAKVFSIDTVEIVLIPEPSTGGLLGLGLGLLAGWRQGAMRNARPQSCPRDRSA